MRIKLIFSLFFLIFISIVFISCTNSSKIEEKKFVKIYAEIIFMQDTSSYSQSVIKNKVLKKFDVKEIEYDETIKYYNDDPERWQKFFDEVIVYIESLKPKPKKNDVKSFREQS
jgi:hypothetical protein